jgi:chromatin assembly factor 1 subunit B
VHIWALKTRDGQFTLSQYNRSTRIELPARRISGSPAPGDTSSLSTTRNPSHEVTAPSPSPSTPGTPTSMSMPMNPPPFSSSRRSSFSGSPAQSSMSAFRRSASPSPALPLPAVKPSSPNSKPSTRSMSLYHNEALLSFFRRLAFSTDGSLLLAPAGQYKSIGISNGHEPTLRGDEASNTVFVYTRAGLNKSI